jgi:hypothetical protein
MLTIVPTAHVKPAILRSFDAGTTPKPVMSMMGRGGMYQYRAAVAKYGVLAYKNALEIVSAVETGELVSVPFADLCTLYQCLMHRRLGSSREDVQKLDHHLARVAAQLRDVEYPLLSGFLPDGQLKPEVDADMRRSYVRFAREFLGWHTGNPVFSQQHVRAMSIFTVEDVRACLEFLGEAERE